MATNSKPSASLRIKMTMAAITGIFAGGARAAATWLLDQLTSDE